jgi:hypothetical protein
MRWARHDLDELRPDSGVVAQATGLAVALRRRRRHPPSVSILRCMVEGARHVRRRFDMEVPTCTYLSRISDP